MVKSVVVMTRMEENETKLFRQKESEPVLNILFVLSQNIIKSIKSVKSLKSIKSKSYNVVVTLWTLQTL